MGKKSTLWAAVLLIAIAGILFWRSRIGGPVNAPATETVSTTSVPVAAYENATYVIDGVSTTLINGRAEFAAAQVFTQYFGNEATGDLTGKGTDDVAFLLTQTTGGSGTFYYIAVALQNSAGYTGTNAIFLGDRIAPQTTQISNGEVVVNYADRKPGDPMTAAPSVGVTKYFRVENGVLRPVANQ